MSAIFKPHVWGATMVVTLFLTSSIWWNVKAACLFSQRISVDVIDVGNMLNWHTAKEVDNRLFIVEKSIDGVRYRTLGQVKGAGHSIERKSYRFLDVATGEKRAFYRLIHVDFKGKRAHTETVLVTREQANNFLITAMSSTMTDKLFTVTLHSEIEGVGGYKVLNYTDEMLVQRSMSLRKGANVFTVDLEGLKNGRYRLVIGTSEEGEEVVIRKVSPADMPRIEYAIKR